MAPSRPLPRSALGARSVQLVSRLLVERDGGGCLVVHKHNQSCLLKCLTLHNKPQRIQRSECVLSVPTDRQIYGSQSLCVSKNSIQLNGPQAGGRLVARCGIGLDSASCVKIYYTCLVRLMCVCVLSVCKCVYMCGAINYQTYTTNSTACDVHVYKGRLARERPAKTSVSAFASLSSSSRCLHLQI